MVITVRLFAFAREAAGRASIDVELPEGATVADVRCALVAQVPSLAPLAGSLMFAIDEQYAADTAPVAVGADIACIPPVSGG